MTETQVFISDYELERGKPIPSLNHSIIQTYLVVILRINFGKAFTIGSKVDLDLPNTQRPTVPDIAIFSKRELALSKDVVKVKEAPLTAIEILSPSQRIEDVKDKIFQNYFPAGVKSAWLIIPTARTVSIYTPDEKFKTYATGKFTDPTNDITLDIDDVFEGLA